MFKPFDRDEPVFKKSRWGTNRHVYNADNPVGLTLIVVSAVFTAVMMLLLGFRAGPFAPPEEPEHAEWRSPETDSAPRTLPGPAMP